MALTLFSPRPSDAGDAQQVCVAVLQFCPFARNCQRMFERLLIVRAHLQTRVTRSQDCEKRFQLCKSLTFARNNSTEVFAPESSTSQNRHILIRLFELDTRVNVVLPQQAHVETTAPISIGVG